MGEHLTRRLAGPALAAALGMVVLAACSSTVPGTAAPAEPPAAAGSPSAAPDVVPSPEPSEGTAAEALRIASAATLIELHVPNRPFSCYPYGPADTPEEVESTYYLPGTVAPVLAEAGFVVSWTQCRAAAAQDGTIIVLSEVSDPAAAQRALPQLIEALSNPDQQRVTLAGGQPALLTAMGDRESVLSWVAQGRMIASVFHVAAPGQGVAEAGLLLDDQVALLAGFVPTPQAELSTLTFNRDGLRDFVIDLPGDNLHRSSGPYDLEGYLRQALDPVREREVLAANGFSGMYTRVTDPEAEGTAYAVGVFRFPSSTETNAVYSAFSDVESSTFEAAPFDLPSIPEAPCFSYPARSGDGTFSQRCYVGFGRYLAYVDVSNLPSPEDTSEMDRLLPLQRDLIIG